MDIHEKLQLFEEQIILYNRIEKRINKYHPFVLTGLVISWILLAVPYQVANQASTGISFIVIFTGLLTIYRVYRNNKRFKFVLDLHSEIFAEAIYKKDHFVATRSCQRS